MNRLTAIGLASLVAYGLLIGSKYAGFVSAAREDRSPLASTLSSSDSAENRNGVAGPLPLPGERPVTMAPPLPPVQPGAPSPPPPPYPAAPGPKAHPGGLAPR